MTIMIMTMMGIAIIYLPNFSRPFVTRVFRKRIVGSLREVTGLSSADTKDVSTKAWLDLGEG